MTGVAARVLLAIALAVGLIVGIGSNDEPEPELVDSSRTLASISLNRPFDDELTRPATDAARYVILRDDLATGIPDIAAIRAANPAAQILLYKDAAFTVWSPDGDGTDAAGEPRCPSFPFQGSGVDYCTADEHEDWFLHRADDSTSRLRSTGYGSQWAMDPGNDDYQAAWAGSVVARLGDADRDGVAEGLDDRYDGVFMDDANLRPGHGLGTQGILGMPPSDPEFPDGANPAYRAAMVEFVDHVTAAIGEAGYLTAANVDADIYDADDRAAALAVAADLDVYVQERFFRLYAEDPGGGAILADILFSEPATESAPDWSDWIDFMGAVQGMGASWLGLTYGRDSTPSDIEAQRFVRASFLIGWDGTDGGALAYRSYDDIPGGPLALSDWTTSIGVPEDEPYLVGSGYRRDFSAGTVVINPVLAGNATFDLGGEFRQPDGSCASSVELAPQRALVLPACE